MNNLTKFRKKDIRNIGIGQFTSCVLFIKTIHKEVFLMFTVTGICIAIQSICLISAVIGGSVSFVSSINKTGKNGDHYVG